MGIEEASTGKNQLAAELAAGVAVLSLNQVVNFTLYVKLILPLDGFVFWVNANLVTDSALFGASQYNELQFGSAGDAGLPAKVVQAKGSLHYATEIIQTEDQNAARNHVTFTTQEQIQDFNAINPNLMYVATFDEVRFSFSRNHNFYKQAQVYHYHGDAIYSIMESQIIDNLSQIDLEDVIVSNSLPLWLGLNQFFPMFPSFLSQQNSVLPYATIDINPRLTRALASAPLIYIDSSHYQLSSDTVKISIFGIRNAQALEFVDYVLDYSRNTDMFGLMNMPIIQDEHVIQKELGIIAQNKTITFEISYFQKNILDIAKKLILSAIITLNPEEL
jgi:hypothetical protein